MFSWKDISGVLNFEYAVVVGGGGFVDDAMWTGWCSKLELATVDNVTQV